MRWDWLGSTSMFSFCRHKVSLWHAGEEGWRNSGAATTSRDLGSTNAWKAAVALQHRVRNGSQLKTCFIVPMHFWMFGLVLPSPFNSANQDSPIIAQDYIAKTICMHGLKCRSPQACLDHVIEQTWTITLGAYSAHWGCWMMETFAWRLLRGAGWPVRKNFQTRKKQSSERPSVIHQVFWYIFFSLSQAWPNLWVTMYPHTSSWSAPENAYKNCGWRNGQCLTMSFSREKVKRLIILILEQMHITVTDRYPKSHSCNNFPEMPPKY